MAAAASTAEPLLTERMVEEEQQLFEQGTKEEEQRTLSRQEQQAADREACLKRLKKLLHATNIYSQFLIDRIEKQNTERTAQQQRHGRGKKTPEGASAEEQQQPSRASSRLTKKQSSAEPPKTPSRKRKASPNSQGTKAKSALLDLETATPPSSQEGSSSRPSNGHHNPEGQPTLFTGGVMRPYQVEGYQWLKVLYENGVNGILADEMGLGKTIQVIALISSLVESGLPGPYLVVAPLSTLPNWLSELQRFTPSLSVVLYHGPMEERHALTPQKLRRTTVVVTSYEVAMRDRARLAPLDWLLLVVDEAHRLKNFRCRLVRELSQYRASNRLLLTGTPLQNSLTELWALLHFLIPEIFHDLHVFESWFDLGALSGANDEAAQFIQREESDHIVSTMQEILKPFLLRRTKDDVVLELPRKTELLVYAQLSPLQEKIYKICMDRAFEAAAETKDEVAEEVEVKPVGRERRTSRKKPVKYTIPGEDDIFAHNSDDDEENSRDSGISSASSKDEARDPYEQLRRSKNPLMDLRKVCNHPYLFRGLCEEDDGTNGEHLVQACGKLRLLDCMLRELKRRGHKVLIFSQMCRVLDILEDYCVMRRFKFCRLDGTTRVEDRQEQMKLFNENPDYFVFLLSTRAGGLGINLTGADTVVLYDSDWNPQCDLQAMDRCHRIGQTRPVLVYRLVTRGTVEQRMIEMAGAKRRLEKIIMQKGKFAKVGKDASKGAALSPQELMDLLHSTDHSAVIEAGSSVLSKAELDALLDRTRLAADQGSAPNRLFEVVVKDSDTIDNLG
ncbi:lymphoid-specific helicase-like isoform X2 [Dermacentor albipictus]|uniref:lymphoid-specific helicase-like isoform X2 n=1 Tax=Dermacentor albipictus TaxID=60249 RepID=UPI0038FC7E42